MRMEDSEFVCSMLFYPYLNFLITFKAAAICIMYLTCWEMYVNFWHVTNIPNTMCTVADLVHSNGLLWLKLCFAALHVFTLTFNLNHSHLVSPNTDQTWLYMNGNLCIQPLTCYMHYMECNFVSFCNHNIKPYKYVWNNAEGFIFTE